MCFLEESYKKMQKIQIFEILKVLSVQNQGVYIVGLPNSNTTAG